MSEGGEEKTPGNSHLPGQVQVDLGNHDSSSFNYNFNADFILQQGISFWNSANRERERRDGRESDILALFHCAFRCFSLAAELGNAAAMDHLAQCYKSGRGVESNVGKMLEWYFKAAEVGHCDAMYNLVQCYWNGDGVKKDDVKAFGWCSKAAELGHRDAMTNLAFCYKNGLGVEIDEARAIEWYSKAAELDDTDAMLCLGDFYADGDGVEKDETKAWDLYSKAAKLGNTSAALRLVSWSMAKETDSRHEKPT